MTKVAIIASVLLAAIGCAHAQLVVRDGVLADAAGRTLYVFYKDAPGKGNCAGGCLAVSPASNAEAAATAQGNFGLIEIEGARQWTVKGKPLYYFSGDTKAGERNGDGSGGVWHVALRSGTAPVSSNGSAPLNPAYSASDEDDLRPVHALRAFVQAARHGLSTW